MAILTIAIPSYNRNSVLAGGLNLLLPQLNDQCVLTIIDNASDVPVSQTLELPPSSGGCPINIIRNRINIGANANVLRCLEVCTTEWVWILGDDDPVKPDAISTILFQIKALPDCLYVNFQSGLSPERESTRSGRGTLEFAQTLDSFSNSLFISTCVFNASLLSRYIGFGYQYAYSYAPHLAVVLAAMGDQGRWCFSNVPIVEVVTTKTVDQLWSPLMPTLGKMTLLELPMGDRARRLLARKISSRPRPELLVLSLVQLAKRRNSGAEAMFLYNQLCARLYWSDRRVSSYFRRLIGGLLVRNWSFTLWAMNFVRKRLTAKKWDRYKGIIDRAGQDQWHRLV